MSDRGTFGSVTRMPLGRAEPLRVLNVKRHDIGRTKCANRIGL